MGMAGSLMVSSSQIREQLAMFLDGRIDLDAFEDWFVQNTWNIHQSGSRSAEALTFAIEESLSEYSSHHLTEEELQLELRSLVPSENQAAEFGKTPSRRTRVR